MTFAKAQAICHARGSELCTKKLEGEGCNYDDVHVWTPEPWEGVGPVSNRSM